MIKTVFLTLAIIGAVIPGVAQQTVFGLLKKDMQLGDEHYADGNYYAALESYVTESKKPSADPRSLLCIARCYFSLKEYGQCANTYEVYDKKRNTDFAHKDLYQYAEALTASARYERAIEIYKLLIKSEPGNELLQKKVWRLDNVHFLFEDSTHYAVRPISLNTTAGELCPIILEDRLLFLSNRKEEQLIELVNGAVNQPFYRLYTSQLKPDTSIHGGPMGYGNVAPFTPAMNLGVNLGPAILNSRTDRLIYTATSREPAADGSRTLQLYFQQSDEKRWPAGIPFQYNSSAYSVSDPSLTPDGRMLFFSSDMPGGFGGRDLYRSKLVEGQWAKPENLGEAINTAGDEVFPYIHKDHSLYFSSTGHAGMGGLDIFKSVPGADGFSEPHNMGYPINSSFDDFGIVLDSADTHGYFSSNRKNGGYDDDIFEFDMDLQTYPFAITGILKSKDHIWSDSAGLKVVPFAKVSLIDNIRKITVAETQADKDGSFSLTIPYYSKYIIAVRSESGEENLVAFDVPKHRKKDTSHEIVLVQDLFKSAENHEVK